MNQPHIAAKFPIKVEMEAGKKYAFCTCGLSASQPFCDGKHSGGKFKPLVFTSEETKSCHFCQCKRTANAPYCDGAHNQCPDG